MIPKKLLDDILEDDYYKTCARSNTQCDGRITFEHVWIYSGKQVQEKWAIIPLCEFHHSVDNYQDRGDLKKEINEWISINRAKVSDFHKYYKRDWSTRRRYLNAKYGKGN